MLLKMSMWKQIMFQDANSLIMENMVMFYDHAMLVIMMIVLLISYILIFMFINSLVNRFMLEGQMIEIIWTVVPMLFLFFLAFPSLKVLYLIDEVNYPIITIKAIGHQWYWSYEYNDFKSLMFESFMIDVDNLKIYEFRLLDVDNRLVLPYNCQIRLLVSSYDVIHSFAMPTLGIKIDAVPGRMNQVSVNIIRPGLYYGQCSEICGVNHSFMPIVIESVNSSCFIKWILEN